MNTSMLPAGTYGPFTAALGSLCLHKMISIRSGIRYIYSSFDDEPESPQQLAKHLRYAFARKDGEELGCKTAVRLQILRLLPAVTCLHLVRVLLLTLPVVMYYGHKGLMFSFYLQTCAYLLSRIVVGSARNYIAETAETILRSGADGIAREKYATRGSIRIGRLVLVKYNKDMWFTPYLKLEKFVLGRNLHLIPAAAICGAKFGGVMRQLLPQNPQVRETVISLAYDYHSSSQSLIEACELLA